MRWKRNQDPWYYTYFSIEFGKKFLFSISKKKIGTLTQLDKPGHFQQQLYFFGVPGPTVDYNIIYIDDEAAIEYDCNEGFLGIGHDYCIHIISRSPTLSQEKTDQLLSFAGK